MAAPGLLQRLLSFLFIDLMGPLHVLQAFESQLFDLFDGLLLYLGGQLLLLFKFNLKLLLLLAELFLL